MTCGDTSGCQDVPEASRDIGYDPSAPVIAIGDAACPS